MSWIRRETEKEAVQYICPHCHDYHEFREDFGERTFSENYIFCRRCGARNGTGNAPTLTPPNEPLTLDELREMDGEPVYVVFRPDGSGVRSLSWALVNVDEKYGEVYLVDSIPGASCYYDEIWANLEGIYRRPPERQEDTHDGD